MCWGSFLNVIGYRLTHGYSLALPRSFCPHCQTVLAWYDLIPVISWLFLRSKCRTCKANISYLYPLIEILTAIIFTLAIIFISPSYWLAYAIFFSALIVTIRTDAETMLISRFTTICLIPIAFTLSATHSLPITILNSIMGAIFGYGVLWFIAWLFYTLTHKEGMGEGDFELLATIGAFTGVLGAWLTLFIGSALGSLAALLIILKNKSAISTKIPFGPWLALGAIIYVFLQKYFLYYYM